MNAFREHNENGLRWTTDVASPYTLADRLGFLPGFLSTSDPRPSREQFDAGYRAGGGWVSSPRMRFNPDSETLHFPGDPVLTQLARTQLRDETILLFPHSWVVIVQPDGSSETARMD